MSAARMLDVSVQRVLHGDGSAQRRATVHCPLQQRTLTIEQCLSCERCSGLRPGVDGHSVVLCDTGEPAAAPTALPAHWRAGHADASTVTPVSEVMTRDVLCVGPEVDVDAIAGLLLGQCVSGAVVVDAEGRPQGVVSTTDLLRERRDRDDTEVVDRSHGPMVRGMHEVSLAGATAGDVMTPVPLAVHESDTVAHAAALMAFEGIHRVVVVGDDGRVVGVLASTDVLRWIGHRAGFLIPSSTCRRRAQD